jgi:hypothetical protein
VSGKVHVTDDEELAMDCELARECLDVARPDARDREDAELLAAFAHLDECPACAEAVEFRRMFDRQVGAKVRAVDVPADLQSRLIAALSAADPAVRTDDPTRALRSRRRAFLAAASAAALLFAAVGTWWVTQRQPAPLAAAAVLDWCRTTLAGDAGTASAALAEFDGSFDAAVGDGRWASQLARQAPQGADVDGDGDHDAAVYAIRGGFLVILPPGRVVDPPAAGSAGNAQRQYSPAPHVAWTFNQQMWVCILPGGSDRQLDALLNRVYGSAA